MCDGNYQRYLTFEGKTLCLILICKRTISKEFMENQGSCIPKEQRGWRQGLHPTLDRRGWRGGICPTLARAGWREVLARHSPGEAGEDGPARHSQACGRRASFRRGGNPPDAGVIPSNLTVPDAQGTVGHRESTILEGFPKHRAISGPRSKSDRCSQACGHQEEICPGGNPPDARSTQE